MEGEGEKRLSLKKKSKDTLAKKAPFPVDLKRWTLEASTVCARMCLDGWMDEVAAAAAAAACGQPL